MNGRYTPYLQMLMQGRYDWNRRGAPWLVWGAVAVGLLVSLGFLMANSWLISMRVFAATVGVTIALLWGIYVRCAVRQNTPAYACLVPQLRQRLMLLAALLGVAGILVTSALYALCAGEFGYALIGMSVFFLYVLAVVRFPVLNSLALIWWLTPKPRLAIFDPVYAWVMRFDEMLFTAMVMPLLALAGLCLLRAVFPRGGDRHQDFYARLVKGELAVRDGPAAALPAHAASSSGRLWYGYQSSLRAMLRDGRAQTQPGRMLLLGLSAHLHAFGQIFFSIVLLLASLLFIEHYRVDNTTALRVMVGLSQLLVMVPVAIYAQDARLGIARTVAEQGLLRLAPRLPGAVDFNRVFGGALLRRFLAVWLTGALCSSAAPMLVMHSLRIDAYTVALAALFLTLSFPMLSDYAAMGKRHAYFWKSGKGLGVLLLFLLLFAVEIALPFIPTVLFAAVCLIPTVLLLRRRWAQLLTQAPALPAGRLA